MKKKRLTFLFTMILAVLVVTSLAYAQQKALKSDDPIKIGYIAPFTGPATLNTMTDVPGIQLAIEEINAAGGVLGRPLKLITRDEKLNPEVALREARDLVINENVFYVTGITSSACARAVSDYMNSQKKIFIIEIAKSDKLTAEWGNRYTFRATNNAYIEAVALAKASVKTFGKLKKIYNLSPDYEGGRSAWRTFLEQYKMLVPDAQVVGDVWAKLGTQDFTSHLTAIMNSDADLLFSAFYQSDAMTMLKQSIAIGLNGKIAKAGFWDGQLEVVQMYRPDFYPKKTIGNGTYAFWALNNPQSKAFVNKIKSKYNVYPGYASNGYAFTKAMAKAIEKVGSLDTEKVINVLEGMTYDSLVGVGQVEMRACDHQAMWPTYIGEIGKLAGWDFYGTTDVIRYGKESYPSCEEIAKSRGK